MSFKFSPQLQQSSTIRSCIRWHLLQLQPSSNFASLSPPTSLPCHLLFALQINLTKQLPAHQIMQSLQPNQIVHIINPHHQSTSFFFIDLCNWIQQHLLCSLKSLDPAVAPLKSMNPTAPLKLVAIRFTDSSSSLLLLLHSHYRVCSTCYISNSHRLCTWCISILAMFFTESVSPYADPIRIDFAHAADEFRLCSSISMMKISSIWFSLRHSFIQRDSPAVRTLLLPRLYFMEFWNSVYYWNSIFVMWSCWVVAGDQFLFVFATMLLRICCIMLLLCWCCVVILYCCDHVGALLI